MSMISKPRVLFLAISLLFHPLIEAVRNHSNLRRHRCRQRSVRKPRPVKHNCSPCPSAKYRAVGDDQCRTCRNCTAINRSFSKECGHHNNAVCGNCLSSYWDVTAYSEGGDGGTQYPCQHCSYDETEAKQCSAYRAETRQITSESFDVTTSQRDNQKTNHLTGNRAQRNMYEQILSQKNESQPMWIVYRITSHGHLLEVMSIVLMIFLFFLVCSQIRQLCTKRSGKESYRRDQYVAGCQGDFCIYRCSSLADSRKELTNKRMLFKDPNAGNGMTEDEEEMLNRCPMLENTSGTAATRRGENV